MNTIMNEEYKIENMIYEVRGKQVMLDSDLAKLYQCANGTKTINLAVKRHIKRFPERFMFQLTKEENDNLRFQLETTNNMTRSLPYVFTEQGVAMLATVLRTEIAEEISIKIMDAFIAMRKYISTNLIEQGYINNQVLKNTENIKLLQESFHQFEERKKVNEIYFNGQIYDAYSKIIDIFKSAKKELIIIDGYCDKSLLDMIRQLKINIILITKDNGKLSKIDIEKYHQQYHNLTVIYDDTFHDRYFITDNESFYHSGTSIHHAGNRTFSINILEDETVKKALLHCINDMLNSKDRLC